jgi:integrase
MPRPAKGARLWLRPEERNTDGTLRKRAVWVIRDGPRKISTGCAAEDRAGAERALGGHLANKYQPNRKRGRHPTEILIADVLAIYLSDVAPRHAREHETKQRVLALDSWWTDKTLADVNGANCRAYVGHRCAQAWKCAKPERTGRPARMVTAAAARRELEDLRAAINYHRREGLCSEIISVALPPRGAGRERWLSRSEAARLLWAAWRAKQIMRNKNTRRAVGRHVARFILVGLYTGTRAAAVCGAALMPTVGRGHVDLDQGVFYRRAIGRRETNKRQPPVKLSPRLLAHMRRWKRRGLSRQTVIEWNGVPVTSVRKGFAAAARAAGLHDVTPHILRHTCATWLMQKGVSLWDAAGFLGMTVQQLEQGYGHHHPDYQRGAVAALGGQNGERNTVNEMGRAPPNVSPIAHSGRGGRSFKSCHSDQHLAEISKVSGTDCGTVSQGVYS